MKIEISVSTRLVGSRVKEVLEIDDEDLPEDSDEREKMIEGMAREAMFELIDWNYEPIEE